MMLTLNMQDAPLASVTPDRLIAFVPTYASIGIWGAVILTFLRVLQGIGVGGEWGGSVLIAMEWARTHKNRGLIAS